MPKRQKDGMLSMRPEIGIKTIKRLQKYGDYLPSTPIDQMINDVLNELEGNKK